MPTIISGDGTITGLTSTGISAVQNLPAGSVLQVVNATYSSLTSTTSTSLVATGLTASITPKFATSKIMIFVAMNGCHTYGNGDSMHFELYKNGSSITYLEDILGYNQNVNTSGSYQYFDAPATTSATTYAIYWRTQAGNTIQLNNYYGANNRTISAITLMEIAQ